MPLRLDIKRKLTARSDRVKSVDLHPTEPWMVASLYNGSVCVWNHETQTLVKTFEVCDQPVRVAKFVARKHWVIAGADDMQIHVFNYNTLERTHMFEAHSDYIRCIAVHPTQPYILTSSDDMLIKLWDWDRKWVCGQVFEGHTHYVMQIVINPKDNNQFASASLDRTIKVWQLGSSTPNFTLEGHEKGVNCIDYYSGGDKPYLISGADDRLVKIWDYQNKTCVQTLEGHAQNVSCVSFHPELPIILTGSEDGTVRVWHSSTYRLDNTLNYGMERVWCVCGQRGANSVALGYDEGSIIIKLGREEPAMSMDSNGKIMWAKHSEVQQANLKAMGEAEIQDGERLSLAVKDMGSCEIYPQTIQHNPNGRFVVVCGDGEYIIYTAMALRNKSFGSAQEFVWAHDSSEYATRESTSMVKIFKNFKEKKSFKPDFGAEGIHGGFLLGVRSVSGLAFYDWENTELVRRIEIQPKHIFWSESGELVCIATEESFFVLRYLAEKVATAQETKEGVTEDGIEDAFEVLGEIQEVVKTGLWVGDCFIYTSSVNRLNYYVGGEIVTIAHLDRTMYLLGYIPKDDRLYLGDKELNIVTYSLLVSVLEYQTAVMRRDFGMADRVLPTIPKEMRTRVAHFLEKQGFRQQALAVSTDSEHRFELALQLGELKIAYQLAVESESEQKWKQLAELATTKCQFGLAQDCLHHAQDYGGLLLLATASGNASMVGKLAEGAERDGKTNVAFLTYFLQGKLDKCLELLIKTNRLPEAAFLARTYLPSHVSRVVKLWKESLGKVNQKAADALADPTDYSNLFPGLQEAFLAEDYLKETHVRLRPAAEYPLITPNEDRNVLGESADFVPKVVPAEPEEVAGSMDETPVLVAVVETPVMAAVVEAAAPEAPVVEESIVMEQVEPVVAAVEEFIPAVEESIPVTEVEPTMAAVEESIEMAEEEPIIVEVEAPKPEEATAVEDTITKIEVLVTIENGTEAPLLAPEVAQSTSEEEVIATPKEAVEEEPATMKPIATDAPITELVTEPIVTEAPVAEATESEPVTIEAVVEVEAPIAAAVLEAIATEPTVTEEVTEPIATEQAPVTIEVAVAAEAPITEAVAEPIAAAEEAPVIVEENEPALAPVIDPTPVLAPAIDPTPVLAPTTVLAPAIDPTPVLAPAIDPTPVLPQVIDLSPVLAPAIDPTPILAPAIDPTPVLPQVIDLSPVLPPALGSTPHIDIAPEPVIDLAPAAAIDPAPNPAVEDQAAAAPAVEPLPALIQVVPPGPEPGPAAPLAAPLEGKGVEEAAPAAVAVAAVSMDLLDLNDKWNDEEGLDDLDLDNFDLDDDIDTTDVNLDDDFLDD
ncbi:coatomer subunit beta'-like isoform X2 [Coregonus clupeaformis]|uniref:coatomer subunit beta'-like isoform X2 n=1 Tax=Coregonus clupeaformis TaxID=59861 RepID=UPI001E1C29AC|nr:coatomer subunit beta'-like isoform X2 [Coregonus clupeaformis]